MPFVLPLILLSTLADGGLNAYTIIMCLNVVNSKASLGIKWEIYFVFHPREVLPRHACVAIDDFFRSNPIRSMSFIST